MISMISRLFVLLSVCLLSACCIIGGADKPFIRVDEIPYVGEKQVENAVNKMFTQMVIQSPLGTMFRPKVTFKDNVEKSGNFGTVIESKLRKKTSWVYYPLKSAVKCYSIVLDKIERDGNDVSFLVNLHSPQGKELWNYKGRVVISK